MTRETDKQQIARLQSENVRLEARAIAAEKRADTAAGLAANEATERARREHDQRHVPESEIASCRSCGSKRIACFPRTGDPYCADCAPCPCAGCRSKSPPRADGGGLVAYLRHEAECPRCFWSEGRPTPRAGCPEGQRLANAVPANIIEGA